jgi:hypothetical protein
LGRGDVTVSFQSGVLRIISKAIGTILNDDEYRKQLAKSNYKAVPYQWIRLLECIWRVSNKSNTVN